MLDAQTTTPSPQPIQLGRISVGATIEIESEAVSKTPKKGDLVVMGGAREDIVAWTKRVGFKRWVWVYNPLAWLMKRTKYRFLVIAFPNRIGHLVSEMDMFLKARELGVGPKIKPILLLRRDLAANPAVVDHLKRVTRVWSSAWAWRLFGPLLLRRELYQFIGEATYRFRDGDDTPVLARWGERAPLAELDPKLREKGRAWLESLGVPRDAWFVSLHVRTAGYSPSDEKIQRFRNANIDNYEQAIREITDRGGYVIRLGDPTMRAMKTDNPKLIDVARIEGREPWTDLFLCAENRFFLGTTSGLFYLAKMFGKPCASSNMIPYGVALPPTRQDVSIPKLVKMANGQLLSFKHIYQSGCSRMHTFYDYMNNKLGCVQNTPEELRDLAVEMMDRLDGRFETSEEDEALQARFKSLIGRQEDCYGNLGRIGRDFLRQHRGLL